MSELLKKKNGQMPVLINLNYEFAGGAGFSGSEFPVV